MNCEQCAVIGRDHARSTASCLAIVKKCVFQSDAAVDTFKGAPTLSSSCVLLWKTDNQHLIYASLLDVSMLEWNQLIEIKYALL